MSSPAAPTAPPTTTNSLTTTPTSTVTTVVKAENPINGKTLSNTPSSYASYGSVCLLCLRTKTCTSVKSDPDKHRQNRLKCIKYVVLVSRYLKLDTELTKISQKSYFTSACCDEVKVEGQNSSAEIDFRDEISKFIVCDLCLPLAESFCKTYHEYELIKMKLEAKILESAACVQKSEGLGESLKIVRGIKRPASLKGSSSESHPTEDALMGFRNVLKTHGSNFIKVKEPRLQLKRDKKAEELVQNKVPKLFIKNFTAPVPKYADKANKSAKDETVRKTTDETVVPTTPKPNPDVKIVRRAAGKQSEISIIRVSNEGSAETESNNNNNDNKIEVIGPGPVQQKSDTVTHKVAPTSVSVSTPNSVPQQAASTVLIPVSTVVLNANIFQSTLTHSQHGFRSDGVVSTSNSMLPQLPIQIQKCNINGCGLTFPKTEQGLLYIQNHLNTHGGLKCAKCTAVLRTPFELISHELKHDETNLHSRGKQGFQCTRCPHYSMLRTQHQEHFLERHLNSKIELLKCQTCKKGFSYLKQQQYRTHITNCHPDEEKDNLALCHSCMICRVYFKKKGTLWKHLKNEHRISCKDGPYKCPDCSDSFSFQSLMLLHREFACEKRQNHKCPFTGCLSTFARPDLVKQHFDAAHKDSNFLLPECPICKLKFYEPSTLRHHVMTHNGEQVKLVFANGNNQEAQVIPVEAETSSSNPETTTGNSLPYVHTQTSGVTVNHGIATMPSTITVAPPLPPSTPPPVIVSVTGAPQTTNQTTNNNVIPAAVNQSSIVPNSVQPLQAVQAEMDTKLFDHFFDESNDSEEPLMEFFQNNGVPINGGEGEDELPPPDEDPFAWLLAEGFDVDVS